MTWNIILILDNIQCLRTSNHNRIADTIFRRLNGTDKILFNKVLTFPEKRFERIHNSEVLPTNYEVCCKGRTDGYGGVLIAVKNTLINQDLERKSDFGIVGKNTSFIFISVSCTDQQIMMKFMHMLLRTPLSISAVYTPRTPYGCVGTWIYPISIGRKIPSQETNTKK